jgi:hypothetical protein
MEERSHPEKVYGRAPFAVFHVDPEDVEKEA